MCVSPPPLLFNEPYIYAFFYMWFVFSKFGIEHGHIMLQTNFNPFSDAGTFLQIATFAIVEALRNVKVFDFLFDFSNFTATDSIFA
jgi:hypothetical protein